MKAREGMTLLELLVVIAILGVLIGLLLPAIQSVREAAIRTQSINNQRQIALAMQGYAAVQGKLPPLEGTLDYDSLSKEYRRHGVHVNLLLYLEGGAVFGDRQRSPDQTNYSVKCYVSPADPTLALGTFDRCSYPVNAFIVRGDKTLAASFPDGTSNTIAFAEHYANCGSKSFVWICDPAGGLSSWEPPVFADGANGMGQIHPVTTGNPPVSRPSFANIDAYPQLATITFQTRPPLNECQDLLAQTPHAAGMIVSLVDGSVRVLSPKIASPVYWGAITPAGGEILADW